MCVDDITDVAVLNLLRQELELELDDWSNTSLEIEQAEIDLADVEQRIYELEGMRW